MSRSEASAIKRTIGELREFVFRLLKSLHKIFVTNKKIVCSIEIDRDRKILDNRLNRIGFRATEMFFSSEQKIQRNVFLLSIVATMLSKLGRLTSTQFPF